LASLYGFEIDSELPLARLNSAVGTRGTIQVRRTDRALGEMHGELCSYVEEPGGRSVAMSRLPNGRLLSCSRTGHYLLEPQRMRITTDSRAPDHEIETRVVVAAACSLLALAGDLVIHAAAVDAGGAVLFSAASGTGKSTLVDALGTAGHPVISEDGVAIEIGDEGPFRAHPGARGIRLKRTQDRAAISPDPGPREAGPVEMRAIVVLMQRGSSFEIAPLAPAAAVAHLTPQLLHGGAPEDLAGPFAAMARIVSVIPAFGLSMPDDLGALPTAARRLMAELDSRLPESPRE
jgi:hypothetical protein